VNGVPIPSIMFLLFVLDKFEPCDHSFYPVMALMQRQWCLIET